MGLERRKKSNRDFGGSKLNVPGQGIFTVERSPNDKVHIHKQIGRIPRPTKTPTITQGETSTPTPTITPTVTPTISITPSITPTITPSVTCERPSGLTFTIALYEYDSNYFTTGLTSSCEALADYNITSGSSSSLGYGINTLNSPIQIGDYVYSGFSFDTNCSTIPDGYYIVTTPSSYIIQVSGGTVISLPNCEIDPLSLGQPLLYYSSYYPSFLSPSPSVSGDPIGTMTRVNDNFYSASTVSGITCSPYWDTLSGNSMVYFPVVSSADPCYNLNYFVDSSTPLDFMYQPGYEYTIYMVAKPESVLYETAIFSTKPGYGVGTVPRSVNLTIDYNVGTSLHKISYLVRNGSGGAGSTTILSSDFETNISASTLDSGSLRVFSVRAKDPSDLITTAAYFYVNNNLVNSSTQLNIPTDINSGFDLIIGGYTRSSTPCGVVPFPPCDQIFQYKGFMSDFIIFNTIHNDVTHYWVTEYLKSRWNIT